MSRCRLENNQPPQLYPFANELAHERFEKSLNQPPEFFSSDYFNLTRSGHSVSEKVSSSADYEQKPVRFPENFVCALWIDQVFKGKYLFTIDRKRIEVIHPGQWNFEKGPDFKNARIRFERGEIAKGDVEIHNFSSEWRAHGHQLNTEYNNVILHVFLWNDKGQIKQRKLNGLPLLQIELKSYLKRDVRELYSSMKLEECPSPVKTREGMCARLLKKAPEKRLMLFLDLAGEARLISKAERFSKKAQVGNYSQLFYEAIMESLGFKYSRLQFGQIAKTVPLGYLKEKIKPVSQKEKSKHIESILFGVAGFLDHFSSQSVAIDIETRAYFNQLREIWKDYENDFINRKLHFSLWNFSGVRPANYPYGRLAGMSFFLSQSIEKDIIGQIYPVPGIWLKGGSAKNKMEHLLNLFPEPENNFWSYRYCPGGKKLASPKRLIGKERISDMVINVFLPILLSFARQYKASSIEKNIYQLYNHFPGLSSNSITRFMEGCILASIKNKKIILNRAKRQQALHQIYLDYCESNKEACNNCGFYLIAKYLICSGKKVSAT